jgi:hypothetical protein
MSPRYESTRNIRGNGVFYAVRAELLQGQLEQAVSYIGQRTTTWALWSRVPRDSDPRKTALGRTSSIYKRQARPLVREGVPKKQHRNCQMVIINIWSWAPDGARHQDLLTHRQSQCDFDLSTEAEESPLLRSVTRKRLLEAELAYALVFAKCGD